MAGEMFVVVEGTKGQDIGSVFLASPGPCCYRLSVSFSSIEGVGLESLSLSFYVHEF